MLNSAHHSMQANGQVEVQLQAYLNLVTMARDKSERAV